MPHPNIVFVFADQMRAEATGYSGNTGVVTPNLDRLAGTGVTFTNCIAGAPVCTPWRACMLTGQYPLTHGLFLNDLRLPTDRPTFGTVLKEAGYRTGYIGKWHLDGNERAGFTPPGPRRQGFDFWAVGNCTHNYLRSLYYRDTPERLYWDGYDATAQTDLALEFIRDHAGRDAPFALFLSWGPPHNPYDTAPDRFQALYPLDRVPVRPNCPNPILEELRGYYAHVSALDEQVGRLLAGLEASGALANTIFVFTSDHGDMLGSHGQQRKQRPWAESIDVPLLIRAPNQRPAGTQVDTLVNVWDLMPTLLSLADVPCPPTVQGRDLSGAVTGASLAEPEATLAACIAPFAEYRGEEWRAVRTKRHTYVRALSGPWLLYDNIADPYQLTNLVHRPESAELQWELEERLQQLLAEFGDGFLPAQAYIERWGYEVDEKGAIPYATQRPAERGS
jgi:arylsulfatase A-like enzyme